ncbi:hypothetical protein OAE73_00895, partial [bacterium]|nr:hypothetical protein [bacterium]
MSSFININNRTVESESKYSATVIKNALLRTETKSSIKANKLVENITEAVSLNEALSVFTDKLRAINALSESYKENVAAEIMEFNASKEELTLNEGTMSDIHQLANEVKDISSFVKEFFKQFGDKIKKSADSIQWVESLYTDMKTESVITEGRSISKIQKDWSETTTKMSQKVIDWKEAEGDRKTELLDELKALTKRKAELETELDDKVAGKDKDLALAISEDHSENPNDKYEVRPCDEEGTPFAVWEGDVRVECFATEEEAQAFADKQNKEQGLTESFVAYTENSKGEYEVVKVLKDQRAAKAWRKKNAYLLDDDSVDVKSIGTTPKKDWDKTHPELATESLVTEAKAVKVIKKEWPYVEFKVGGKTHKVEFDYEDVIDDHGNEGQDQYWLGKDDNGKEWSIDVYTDYNGNVEEVHYDTIVAESAVTEARYNKKSLLKKLGKADDARIQTGNGKEYIIYNPDSNNDDNAAMWNDNSVFAVDQDGEEHEIDYKDIGLVMVESTANEAFSRMSNDAIGNELYAASQALTTYYDWLKAGNDAGKGKSIDHIISLLKKCKSSIKRFNDKEETIGTEYESPALESVVNEAVSKATKIYQIATPAPQSMLVEELENLFGDDYRNIVTEFTEDEGYESVIMFNLSKSDIKKIENNIADVLIWEYSIKKGKEITESLVSEAKGFKNTTDFEKFLIEIDGMGESQIRKIMGKDYIDTPGYYKDEKGNYDDVEDFMRSNMGDSEFEELESWWENNVAESIVNEDVLCEATVVMDAVNPDDKDFLKFLKKNKVKVIDTVKSGPTGHPEITMQGKRKDLEIVLADGEYGWDDPGL